MALEQMHDQWSPDHPVRWCPADDSDDAWMTLDEAAQRIHRLLDVGYPDAAAVRDALLAGKRFHGRFADYEYVEAVAS